MSMNSMISPSRFFSSVPCPRSESSMRSSIAIKFLRVGLTSLAILWGDCGRSRITVYSFRRPGSPAVRCWASGRLRALSLADHSLFVLPLLLSEFVLLDLPRRGRRQFLDELDPVDDLVPR